MTKPQAILSTITELQIRSLNARIDELMDIPRNTVIRKAGSTATTAKERIAELQSKLKELA